jgi:cell division protein FtsI (penicillin-binding protein 3)
LEAKKDILWRSYLIYLLMLVVGGGIIARTVYIQQVEGGYWRSLSDSLHLQYREMDAERGTIYSEDGRMLSSSIPYFDVFLDFGAAGVREKSGKFFKKELDTLAMDLAYIFNDATSAEYKRQLSNVFNRGDRYYLLKKNIDFNQYKALRKNNFIDTSSNKNGFIFVEKEKRIAPFGLLANRTIGLSREYINEEGKIVSVNVGLEKTYDSLLKGVTGKRLVRRIAGGAYVPVEGQEIEPENGKDIITTLDINIQDVAEQALLKALQDNEATNGTCIVMEVKTGKIKAIANLGRQANGGYHEDFNYAITRSEPGSTFKLVTMLAALEDQFITLNSPVNLENGKWTYAGRTVYDSERHEENDVTYKRAFELSSNVAMAKLAVNNYAKTPQLFLNHLDKLHINRLSGVNLSGESNPLIPRPGNKAWSKIAIPWMSFGYNISISPLQTLMIYNAVANGGSMMKPYLVNAIVQEGKAIKEFVPFELEKSICSQGTLKQLKSCLEGVVEYGTARSLRPDFYTIAGKTGTALVANGKKGYSEKIYQSSFAGYFPADAPKYSCIVVIKNKAFADKYYGAAVAGPVFKAIADKLMTIDQSLYASYKHPIKKDSTISKYAGAAEDFKLIAKQTGIKINSTGKTRGMAKLETGLLPAIAVQAVEAGIMPDLKGFGLKDALELLERQQLLVVAVGKGKVIGQSIASGTQVYRGQTIYLDLGGKID